MYMTRKRESDGILDPWDVQIPRKYTDYLIALCWTAQQRKPQSQSKNQARLNLRVSHCRISRAQEGQGWKFQLWKMQ